MPVPGEEFANAEGPLAMSRAEHDDIADSTGNQLYPAQDEGPQKDFAQLAVALDQRQQVVATDFDDFAGCSRPDLGEGSTPREHGSFAGEHSGGEGHHQLFARARGTNDVDPAGRNDEEAIGALSRLDQHLPSLDP